MFKTSIFLATALILGSTRAKQLRFNEKGTFKMVQFTDIHFGEDDPDDLENQRLMSDILE